MKIERQLHIALSHLEKGDLENSLEICQQILDQYPNCAIAYRILGHIREAQEQLTEAALAYTKAIELQPDDAAAYAHLAQLYHNSGWIDDAVLLYKTAIKLKEDWTEIYYHLGESLYKQGSFEEAISSYQQAIFRNPQYVEASLGLALTYNIQAQSDRAIAILKQAIHIAPNYTKAYNALGCLLIENNQYSEAIEIFKQAISQKPNWAILHNNMGQAWLAQEKKDQAISAYLHALEIQPNLTVTLLNLAKLYQQHNQHKIAIDYFQKAIQQAPENILAYSDCGYSFQKQGQFDRAITYYQKAITLDSKFVEAYCQRLESMSISETETDEWRLAQIACVRFLRKLQKFYPERSRRVNISTQSQQLYDDWVQFHIHFGNALLKYGQPDQAARHYYQALQIQPQQVEIYTKLVSCLIQQKQWNSAIATCHFAKAIRQKNYPKNKDLTVEFDFLLGYIAEKKQRWETAINYYTKALQQGQSYNKVNLPKITDSDLEFRPQNVIKCTEDYQDGFYTEICLSKTTYIQPSPDSYQDCGGLECQRCLKQIGKQLELINLGNGIYTNSLEKQVPVPEFKTFVAGIPNGRAWIVPQENDWMICKAIAILTPENQLLADISREYPGELPGCQGNNSENHQILKQEKFPTLKSVKGKVSVLSGLSGHIYFHWMVDVLPRIHLLRQSGLKLEEINAFVVNSIQKGFQKETLSLLGIPTEKILESDKISHLQAEQLIVPSFAGYLGWLQPWAIDFLRETFLPLALEKAENSQENYPDKIYISRKKARHRHIINEAEVLEVLRPLGFVEVFLESWSFSEQVRLFSQAKVIVAAHGSGLTNIIFCNRKVKVIELMSPHYQRYYYRVISQYLKLKHYSLLGEGFVCYPIRNLMYPNPLTEDICVNLSTLKRLIQQIRL